MKLSLIAVATILILGSQTLNAQQHDYDYQDYQDYAGDYGQQDTLYQDYADRAQTKA